MANPTGSCDHCWWHLQLPTDSQYGFNESAYAYCNQCSFTVLLSGWAGHPAARRVNLRIHERMTPDVEPLLKRCPCGGVFLAEADPKCPRCAQTLSGSFLLAPANRNLDKTSH